MVYGNRRSNYVLRSHASSPIGLSAISSISSIRLMRSIVRFQRLLGQAVAQDLSKLVLPNFGTSKDRAWLRRSVRVVFEEILVAYGQGITVPPRSVEKCVPNAGNLEGDLGVSPVHIKDVVLAVAKCASRVEDFELDSLVGLIKKSREEQAS